MARQERRGAGITASEATAYDAADAADLAALADAHNAAWDAGGGTALGMVAGPAVAWARAVLDANPGPAEPDSAADWARRIINACRIAAIMADRGDAQEAARCGFVLGHLAAAAAVKFNWERDALNGRKQAVALRHGAAEANSERSADRTGRAAAWQAAADRHWRAHPEATARAVAEWITRDMGGCANTIRRQIQHPGLRKKR